MASDLQFNKYAGALLATALGILGLREVSNIMFEPDEVERAGYAIEVPESLLGGAEEGPNGTGPGLWGSMGGQIAAHAGFAYSDPLKAHAAANPVWTYDEMDAFLKAPQRHVPGTKMTFAGLRNVDDRINLIAYMRTMTDAPPPIPAPDPTRQPGAAPAEGVTGPPAAGREPELVPEGQGQPTSAEGAAGLVPAPAGGTTGSPPTAAGGGMAGQTPAYGQPGGAPQAVTPSPGGDQGGRGVGSLSPGGGGTTSRPGTALPNRAPTNPAAQNPTPTPRRNPASPQ